MLFTVAPVQSYWPFHRRECRRNEFADLIEDSEPKFASWMRSHGKMAVLKDDEVDRLERAGKAVSGPGRDEVMRSMYGRLEPKPLPPAFSKEELEAMERAKREGRGDPRAAALEGVARRRAVEGGSSEAGAQNSSVSSALSSLAASLPLPSGLGVRTPDYSWTQTQSRVELLIPLPPSARRHSRPSELVAASLGPNRLSVVVDGAIVVHGTLWRETKVESSTWYVHDGVLEVSLLKRHRRGSLEDGKTVRDSFWPALVQEAPGDERLQGSAPKAYFQTPWEDDADGQDEREEQRNAGRARAANAVARFKAEKGGKINAVVSPAKGKIGTAVAEMEDGQIGAPIVRADGNTALPAIRAGGA